MHKPALERRTEPTINHRAEAHRESDQVHELATLYIAVELLVKYKGMG